MIMYCQKCGTKLDENVNFCKACGSQVTEDPIIEDPEDLFEELDELPKTPRSRVLAGILAILFGSYGLHNFYLGRKERGLAQLLLTLCAGDFTLTVFPIDQLLPFLSRYINNEVSISALVCVWSILEGIFILAKRINTDGNGVPLKD